MLVLNARKRNLRLVATCFRRFINCNSCGVQLQSKDSSSVGFYLKPKTPEAKNLNSLEDVRYLLFSQELQSVKEGVPVGSLEDLKKAKSKPLICKRCSDSLYLNKYTKEDFPRFSFDQVLNYVPKNGNIIHVVPLPEFPFHVSKKALQGDELTSTLVLTKGDQLAKDKATLQRKVSVFFKDFMKYHLGLTSNKIIATSALKKWNIRTVFSNMKASNYLLGDANVGKSTLINGLLREFMGYKVEVDRSGNVTMQQPLQDKRYDTKSFLKAQNAGVSHIPNMTRNLQAYKVSDKVICDLPGFTTNLQENDLDDIIRHEWLEKIRKTHQFKSEKLKKKTYISLKGTDNGGCLTVGGIFFLVPPPGSINQVVKYIPGPEYQFSNVTKALEVFKSCNESADHSLAKFCGIKPEVSKLDAYDRHVIPPFQGSIEIVFKDIGYILLRSTGKYNFTSPYEIWAPKGIQVCIREPLHLLIESGFMKNVESSGKESACPRKRLLVSSTYIMPVEETKPLDRMKEMYLQRTQNDLSSRRFANADPWEVVKNLRDEPPNLYWHYQW